MYGYLQERWRPRAHMPKSTGCPFSNSPSCTVVIDKYIPSIKNMSRFWSSEDSTHMLVLSETYLFLLNLGRPHPYSVITDFPFFISKGMIIHTSKPASQFLQM